MNRSTAARRAREAEEYLKRDAENPEPQAANSSAPPWRDRVHTCHASPSQRERKTAALQKAKQHLTEESSSSGRRAAWTTDRNQERRRQTRRPSDGRTDTQLGGHSHYGTTWTCWVWLLWQCHLSAGPGHGSREAASSMEKPSWALPRRVRVPCSPRGPPVSWNCHLCKLSCKQKRSVAISVKAQDPTNCHSYCPEPADR